MFKMGSLLAFGTVYLLMHMCAWAQETSEESSVRFTVEFYVEVITSLLDQLQVVSLFSFLIFFSHSFCRKEQFIPNFSFGIGDFTDLQSSSQILKHWCDFPLPNVDLGFQSFQCSKIRSAQHWGRRGAHLSENKGVKSECKKSRENSRQMAPISTICDEYCRSSYDPGCSH